MTLFCPASRAEESSILNTATVIGSDINSGTCPDPQVLISGYFKTHCDAYQGSGQDDEYVINLQEKMTLHTVYVGNYYSSRSWSYVFGTVEIRLGDDS